MRYLKCQSHDHAADLQERVKRARVVLDLVPPLKEVPVPDGAVDVKLCEKFPMERTPEQKTVVK